MPSARCHRERGFTLVDVMVVIVILGILATLVAVNVRDTADTARLGAAEINVRELKKAVDVYYVTNARLPETWGQLLERDATGKQYLDAAAVPVDPWGNEYRLQRGERANEALVVCFGPDRQEGTEDDITSRR